MEETLKNFARQFDYEPFIEHSERLGPYQNILVSGMGGSALAGELLKVWDAELPLKVHRDYGFPSLEPGSLLVASSYSGNTEEVLDALHKAHAKGLPLVAISIGGELLREARQSKIPYIQIPDRKIQPRLAIGFMIKALLCLFKRDEALGGLDFDSGSLANEGALLAKKLKGKIPIIYSSVRNAGLAYIWKIAFNETAKIPAFTNSFPELNHNEIAGFGADLFSKHFHFILIQGADDHPRIGKRMQVFSEMFNPVETLRVLGNSWSQIFNAVLLAHWTAFYTAREYGVDPDGAPVIEEFKGLIK